jgi:hypothetical protein
MFDINIGTLLVIMVVMLILYCFIKCDKEFYENFVNMIYGEKDMNREKRI